MSGAVTHRIVTSMARLSPHPARRVPQPRKKSGTTAATTNKFSATGFNRFGKIAARVAVDRQCDDFYFSGRITYFLPLLTARAKLFLPEIKTVYLQQQQQHRLMAKGMAAISGKVEKQNKTKR